MDFANEISILDMDENIPLNVMDKKTYRQARNYI